VKARVECIFPGPGRAPRKSKKPPDTELLARLRRLEGVVKSLNTQVVDGDAFVGSSTTISGAADEKEKKQEKEKEWSCHEMGRGHYNGYMYSDPRKAVPHVLDQEFGRLVIGDGKSRYVSNRFWASLGDEVMIPPITQSPFLRLEYQLTKLTDRGDARHSRCGLIRR
jgi:hypothetical protein